MTQQVQKTYGDKIGIKRNNECSYVLLSSDVNPDQVSVSKPEADTSPSSWKIPFSCNVSWHHPHYKGRTGLLMGKCFSPFHPESLQTREAHQMVLPSMGSHSSAASSMSFCLQDWMPTVSATQLCAPNHLRQCQYIAWLSFSQVCLEKQYP